MSKLMTLPALPAPAARHERRVPRPAALLDGLVVAAVCMGLVMLGLALHGRQSARLERERAVRLGAWQRALVGCPAEDPVPAFARAALGGHATAEAEARAVRVRTLGGAARAPLVPCNERPSPAEREWSSAQSYLEQHLLPSL